MELPEFLKPSLVDDLSSNASDVQIMGKILPTSELKDFAMHGSAGDYHRHDEAEAPHARVGVITIGVSAGQLMADLSDRLPYLDKTIYIASGSEALTGSKTDNNISDRNGIEHFVLKTNSSRNEISRAVSGLHLAFVIVEVDAPASTVLMRALAGVLRANQIATLGVAITHCGNGADSLTETPLFSALNYASNTVFCIPAGLPVQSDSVTRASMTVGFEAKLIFEMLYRSVARFVCERGLVCIDLQDVMCALSHFGRTAIGCGSASGERAAQRAMGQAISHALLGAQKLRDASGVLVAIEGGAGVLNMRTMRECMTTLRAIVPKKTELYFSAYHSKDMDEGILVTILTGGIC